jgi:hypothetical protein
VASGLIVEHLDIFEHVAACRIENFVDPFFDSLLFQTTEEGLRDGIIPGISPATHTRLYMMLLAEALSGIVSVL